jgi:hypothetical protein
VKRRLIVLLLVMIAAIALAATTPSSASAQAPKHLQIQSANPTTPSGSSENAPQQALWYLYSWMPSLDSCSNLGWEYLTMGIIIEFLCLPGGGPPPFENYYALWLYTDHGPPLAPPR